MHHLSPLHQAIISDSPNEVRDILHRDPQSLQQTDPLGFSPLEIAKLLGRKRCLDLLAPGPETPIRIALKQEKRVRECSEQEFEALTGVRYTPTLLFRSYESLVETIKRCPWYLRYTSLDRESRWLGSFYRREFFDGTVADVTIRWIDDELGYGLFANRPLRTADFVAEYTGVVRKRKGFFKESTDYSFRYPSRFWSFGSYLIDAQTYGNYSRFINHSDTANCIPHYAVNKGLVHIVFRAKHPISAGEQLTIHYGKAYWRTRTKKSN